MARALLSGGTGGPNGGGGCDVAKFGAKACQNYGGKR
eukprot:CAMPEP_0119109988 /NCGR_PEP_ID=MMETSP1180-20130426/25586_1 /TAXON_ID=3052 ORGANISM="Chlamydomonas cf sp, Strain CCMP681" /NCGR_SAMPLE_ID=MMETSP1180 /ASSEMBLY_ACC=CAM_ASM_000741 /LENGTH=36 /DNA_ID= /DNA_START= /DNA_END= /DNA_ORIENTATION=